MDETPSADRLPPTVAPNESPANKTRNTGAVATDPAPDPTREYPEVPGYEVLGILGRGGMGVVYRARQSKANRLVALKMIRAVEDASPMDRLRFQIETEAVARLQHPHIVQLYEAGEVRGQPFFSLEFCDGGNLSEQLKKQRPSPREAAALIETLARAMHYAHLRGVVHRDLKPGNVLLASPGRESGESSVPKITDFGLAKRIDAEARDVSQSGAIMGTAAYMAPEQAAGKVRDTGPAADVYALGALLYTCLAGQPPFEGPQLDVLMRVVSEEPVPPSRLAAKVPRDLEVICLKCLSKQPERRYASAEELAGDLRRFQTDEPIRARAVGRWERARKWMKRNPALVALFGVAITALISLAVLSAVALDEVQRTRREADKAKKTRDLLFSVLKLSDQKGEGSKLSLKQVLEHCDRRIATEFSDDPQLKADMEAEIEELYTALGVAGPQAMILEARGTVRLESARLPKRQAVSQTLLYQGDRLILGDDADVRLVFLWDFRKERLKPSREVSIRHRGCQPRDAVQDRDDDILMTFVPLPKGTFNMGWDGKTPHDVSWPRTEIKEDFEIAAHDVTQYQWEAVMGNNPSFFSPSGPKRDAMRDISDEELKLFPVESVSWDDVQEFIGKLNEKERGRGYLYRLPTEAEWEYACRGGATSQEECSYFFYLDKPTNRLSPGQANACFRAELGRDGGGIPFSDKGYKLFKANMLGTLHATRVGAYPSNKLGLCDMHGNVRQWCADEATGKGSVRSIRGGSYFDRPDWCQAAFRHGAEQTSKDNEVGFRLVRVPVR